MEPTRTVMTPQGEILGNLVFVIQTQQALPCLHMTIGNLDQYFLIPWKKLRLMPSHFVLDMTREEILGADLQELSTKAVPSEADIQQVQRVLHDHRSIASLN